MVKYDMEISIRDSKICLAKPHTVAASLAANLFVLVMFAGCVSTSSTDSQLNSVSSDNSFTPENAEGYPQINTGNTAVDTTINARLAALVDRWQCPAEGESQFNLERHSLSADYLSIQYSAMQLCSGMPSPDSFDSALTFSLTDGAEVSLQSITQCQSTERLAKQAEISDLDARVEGCSAPQISGHFYIDKDNVSLLNFYPSHNDIGCEFELVKSLSELTCQ